MTMSMPDWMSPSCANLKTMSFLSGAVTSATGLDRLLPLPSIVHTALAGAGANYYCKKTLVLDQEYAMSMAFGVMGGVVAGAIMG